MDTFCVLPWYSLELPNNSPCCLLPNNTDVNQLKNDLLSGIKSPACSACWDLESKNQKSRRQFENKFLDYKLNQDLSQIKQDCIDQQNQTLLYQLATSNLCNQACVSCGSGASTKWAEIETKMGLIPKLKKEINLEKSDINYSNATRISLLGGEPLFDPATFKILEQLIRYKNTDCFISLITNGSITLNQKQLDILSKFTDLNICISIDGIGPVFEYLRWPAKWNTLVNNLELYKTITKNISVSYTISSLNLLYYEQTIKWFEEQNLRYNHNIVTSPEWLSVRSTPKELKQLLKNTSFATSWFDSTKNEISIKKYQHELLTQDRAKRIHIKNYLPEIWEILKDSASLEE